MKKQIHKTTIIIINNRNKKKKKTFGKKYAKKPLRRQANYNDDYIWVDVLETSYLNGIQQQQITNVINPTTQKYLIPSLWEHGKTQPKKSKIIFHFTLYRMG